MYETKSLLRSLATSAILAKNKQMYQIISLAANVEGVILEPYEEGVKMLEGDAKDRDD